MADAIRFSSRQPRKLPLIYVKVSRRAAQGRHGEDDRQFLPVTEDESVLSRKRPGSD